MGTGPQSLVWTQPQSESIFFCFIWVLSQQQDIVNIFWKKHDLSPKVELNCVFCDSFAMHTMGGCNKHCRPLWPILAQFFVCNENLWTVMRLLYLNLMCSMGIVHFSQFTISCRTDHQYIDISIYDYWFLLYFKIIDIIDQGIGKCPAD